jgi:hypothetical protein
MKRKGKMKNNKVLLTFMLIIFYISAFAGITISELANPSGSDFFGQKAFIGGVLAIGCGIYVTIGAIRFFSGNEESNRTYLLAGLVGLIIGIVIMNI